MKKYLICKQSNLEPIGLYHAESIDLSAISVNYPVVHVLVPDGVDYLNCKPVYDGTKWVAEANINYLEIAQRNCDFGRGIIFEFIAENQQAGISIQATLALVTAMNNILMLLMIGALETAAAAMLAIPAEMKDGLIINDTRILEYVNKIEQFLGLPITESVP